MQANTNISMTQEVLRNTLKSQIELVENRSINRRCSASKNSRRTKKIKVMNPITQKMERREAVEDVVAHHTLESPSAALTRGSSIYPSPQMRRRCREITNIKLNSSSNLFAGQCAHQFWNRIPRSSLKISSRSWKTLKDRWRIKAAFIMISSIEPIVLAGLSLKHSLWVETMRAGKDKRMRNQVIHREGAQLQAATVVMAISQMAKMKRRLKPRNAWPKRISRRKKQRYIIEGEVKLIHNSEGLTHRLPMMKIKKQWLQPQRLMD